MKKALLLTGFAAMSSMTLGAFEEPVTLETFQCLGVSANGRYVVSSYYGDVSIFDCQTGQRTTTGASNGEGEFELGLGKMVSNDGVVLGSTDGYNAAYWKDGVWTILKTSDALGAISAANSITPDGSRICGNLGCAPMSIDGNTAMSVPCIWDRNADGTYGDYVVLPHPEKDIFGGVPQYVTGIAMSDDGKTIVGQIVDNNGFVLLPVVYTEDEDGVWTWHYADEKSFKPEGVTIPVNPGEPKWVNASDYMTEEEQAQYNAAYQEYADAGYVGDAPDAAAFMSEEKKAEYTAAKEAYDKADELYQAFSAEYWEYMATVPNLQFNDVRLSPDGSKYYTTAIKSVENPDPYAWSPFIDINTPYIMDLKGGTSESPDFGESLMVSNAPNNDVYFTTTGINSLPMLGFIVENGAATEISKWLSAKSPELKTWIDENWIHYMEVGYDYDTNESIFADLLISGTVYASADLNLIAVTNGGDWAGYVPVTYVIDLSDLQGVADAVRYESKVAFDAEGNLSISDDITSVEVYDLAGRRVLSGVNGARNLENGIYVVRATTAAGNAFSTKIAK